MIDPQFQLERQKVYARVPYFFPDLYEVEYALLDIKKHSLAEVKDIRKAAEQVGAIFRKVVPLLRELDDETLLQLGIPSEALAYCRLKSIPQDTIIGRLDFVVSESGIKLMEFNSDTPTFIKEAFQANDYVCNYYGAANPNETSVDLLRKEMRKAVAASWNHLNRPGTPKIVFTSHGDNIEDLWTTRFLQEHLDLPSEYVSLDQLQILTEPVEENGVITDSGLFTPSGERIDILYRQTYPIEHLVNDKEPTTNENIGQELIKLIIENKVMVLNPPSAFLLQSKAVQALIWGLHEENLYFTTEEQQVIGQYFLPTYLEPDKFLTLNMPYVRKPSLGREGDTVEIFNGAGETIDEEPQKTYIDNLPVYQAFYPLPETEVQTTLGTKHVHLMYGCFLLNDKAGAIGIRAGGAITNNLSYFLPIGIEEKLKG
ncbi:glutathionylspermidine synthase family protein [Paenisporosarcina quisquiliarum]|uniref:Glutathionylspermidine synthase family protein n=1 Tax=Paenisporosarcina quisquiliarum TaxID=365346 RepID=A0A9X3LDC5_9BACL|nr:glutathionylspermidine synthase family protein [Paenisporosarcina quisquiliarum]MCZ8535943.1 glutathionylspermidine synthase family protein [Paenisporosarcina quisquiliarum]